ncbi:hypothetical protein [uncultured phage cr113_1]|uniref:Uncharacterized protein n=1 Tax=uncultured phage cr113_1 TaxID=2772087 RepID=A0A7M1RWK3_9CAUD|nr:hypothetical protein KNV54_gp52 [uncultured phage cr113_1]QOR57400.1 hypothetical protein [uncultured phage cr113_1]
MKTLLYNPIFINPLAYYVFPRLTRYLQPDNESTAEPANYIGTIEVRVIAYGDTNLVRTYTNTNEIDLSEFKNTYIRISLFTKVGSCVLGEWKVGGIKEDLPYIDPEVLESLRAVVVVDNKNNYDKDRATITNLVDPDNPFIASNFAWKANSGYGKYEEDFTQRPPWYAYPGVNVTPNKISLNSNFRPSEAWIIYKTTNNPLNDFKVKITGIPDGGTLYFYLTGISNKNIKLVNGNNDIKFDIPTTLGSSGFRIENPNLDWSKLVIEQIPFFQGALVTDGVDDLITSTKTAQEMLGGSTEITVVSMINSIIPYRLQLSYTNAFPINRTNAAPLRNEVSNTGKTGIYGYTYKNNVVSVINNVLGDKNDYTAAITGEPQVDDRFEVTRTKFNSSVAWYWTFIAKKALTTDQINQVIAYFNLDRTLKPDILCNTIKQGITNENHAEFGDRLIDFSGNGRDIQLNNIAWKGDSGIGKYVEDFTTWYGAKGVLQTFSKIEVTDGFKHNWVINRSSGESAINSFKVLIKGIPENGYIQYRYFESEDATKKSSIDIYEDGEYSLPNSTLNNLNDLVGFQLFAKIPPLDSQSFIGLTITQIPSHAGSLCLDGVNDFGKVTGMPIYKDYTFIIDRQIITNDESGGIVASKSESAGDVTKQGAFIFEYLSTNAISTWSYYKNNSLVANSDSNRNISYQSKYSYNGKSIEIGESKDSDKLWIGTIRDNDDRFANIAIYSLMSFPYSMSEFLIERQLKKHKLGTLYPDMVEFRPVIKSNASYDNIVFYYKNEKVENGTYFTVGSSIGMHIRLSSSPVNEIKSITINGIPATFKFHDANNNIYQYDFNLTSKSPQKINITIDEYIRFEDIVQPYPVLLRFNDENGNEVSWGGKFRVGSTITRIGSIADPESNLLNGLYSVSGLSLNGKAVTSSTSIVEKQMVFKTTATYLLDNNEPKCILSPSRLRIPNSSYKILGHIPDISGHGNHGVIHNSAYAEGSGVNEDGSYQLDGVDDFVTIPTTVGGKQVLMKVNWLSDVGAVTLYDQRLNLSDYEFAIYNGTRDLDDNPVMAYQGRNNGQTYIDGILNSNIMASELKAITHNITITNELSLGINNTYPVIGSTRSNTHFAQMSLYDFMLFDDISTDDKIKQLNEYVGIEGNTDDLFNETN